MSSQRAVTILLALLCLVLCLPGVTHAEDTDLGALADALNLPTMGGPVQIGESITLGHAEITLRNGGVAQEILAGSKRCGVLIGGGAWLTYRVDDPMSAPVAERTRPNRTHHRCPRERSCDVRRPKCPPRCR